MNLIQMKAHIIKETNRIKRTIPHPLILCYHDSHELLTFTLFKNPNNDTYEINKGDFVLSVDSEISKDEAELIHKKISRELYNG